MEQIEWGAEPEYFGPRHYYRESILVKNIKKRLHKGTLLDTGLGNGSLSIRLSKEGYKIIGIDISQKFIDYVSRKTEGLNNLVVKKGNIMHLNFEKDSFDGVICSEVLEHLKEDDKAIKEIRKVLKKGGYLFISVPANPKLWDQSDKWAGHYRRYTKERLKSILERNNFKLEKMHFWGFPLTRTYHRNIYLKTLNNSKIKGTKLKKHSKLLSNIFKLDSLFNWSPLGIGIIAIAKNEKTIN